MIKSNYNFPQLLTNTGPEELLDQEDWQIFIFSDLIRILSPASLVIAILEIKLF